MSRDIVLSQNSYVQAARGLWQHAAGGTRHVYDMSNVLRISEHRGVCPLHTAALQPAAGLAKTTNMVEVRCDLHWQCMGLRAGAVGICACVHTSR